MGIILNEVIEAEKILESGNVRKKPFSDVLLLARYYRQIEKLGKVGAYNKLNDFMKKNYKGYNPAIWEDIVENAVKKGTKYPLLELEYIGITQKEIDTIRAVGNLKYERLLFTMLCYAKFYNTVNEKNNSWVNAEVREIYNVARVTVRHKYDKYLYLNDFLTMGFIEFSPKNDNMNMRLTYVDMDGKPVLKISDYRELGYEYLNFIGEGRFARCEVCGKMVRIKSKTKPQKYCNDCAKIVLNQQKREFDKRKSEKISSPQIQ